MNTLQLSNYNAVTNVMPSPASVLASYVQFAIGDGVKTSWQLLSSTLAPISSFTGTPTIYRTSSSGMVTLTAGTDYTLNSSGLLTLTPTTNTMASQVLGTGTGTQLAFTITTPNASTPTVTAVYVNGVLKTLTTDYTVSGSTITFVVAPAAGLSVTASYTYVGGLAIGSTLSWSGTGTYGVWDLMVDGSGNIATATGPYALAQDVASAIQTYQGEVYYDTTLGLPYLSDVMGQPYAPSILQPMLKSAALSVPGVLEAQVSITSFVNRKASGVVNITDATGEALGIHF